MKKFFKSLLALILILVIVGGLGYIGYSYYFMNPSSMSANGQVDASSQNAMQDSMNMQGGSMADPAQPSNTVALEAVRVAMANKESLDTAIAALNEAMNYMTLDPYSPSEKTDTMGSMNEVQTPQTTPAPNSVQGNTTINIYPETNTTQQSTSTPNMTMTNMGTVYDATKMEQLHTGLYKLSVGMQLLGQLGNELTTQAEYANKDIQNPIQYYSNQYTLVLQNKNKLSNALTYINEASTLVNINPYVSEKGLVYDKDRMKKIHESILKMAQGVASLNKLSDDMTMQAVNSANTAQNYANNANTNGSMGTINNTTGGILGGISTNINMPTIVNIILILFVTMFILGLFGFIFSLLKTSTKNSSNGGNIKG